MERCRSSAPGGVVHKANVRKVVMKAAFVVVAGNLRPSPLTRACRTRLGVDKLYVVYCSGRDRWQQLALVVRQAHGYIAIDL